MATICTTALPVLVQNFCDPKFIQGPIEQFFWTRKGDSLTDASDPDEWDLRLSNSTALPSPGTDAPIRYIDVIGELPLPEVPTVEASRGRTFTGTPKYTASLLSDDLPTEMMTFANAMKGKTYTYSCWFVAGGRLFGGNTGFDAQLSVLGFTIPNANTDLMKLTLNVVFEGDFPGHIASPFE